MGNFYMNISIQGAPRNAVKDYLTQKQIDAFISQEHDFWTVIFPIENGDPEQLGMKISEKLGCVTMSCSVYDDDIFRYALFRSGREIDRYTDNVLAEHALEADYFEAMEEEFTNEIPDSRFSGGNVSALAGEFKAQKAESTLHEILTNEDYTFATDRHSDLFTALGLPSVAVGIGYCYITSGDYPSEYSGEFEHIKINK